MKRCTSCRRDLALASFPPYSAGGTRGLRGQCRECWNRRWSPVVAVHQNRYYQENRNGLRERVQERTRQAYYAPGGRAKRLQQVEAYEARYPEKTAARRQVQIAVRSGRLVRQACEVCGAPRTDAHHDDYSRPLDVRWLCRTHHGERHRLLNRGLIRREFPLARPELVGAGR